MVRPVHKFNNSHELGVRGEGLISHYLTDAVGWKLHATQPDESRPSQRRGFDRRFIVPSGADVKVEIKTDERVSGTGHVFVETLSIVQQKVPGWARTSQADLLLYWNVHEFTLYVAPMPTVKDQVDSWLERYREADAMNDGYLTRGVLVPVFEFVRSVCRNFCGLVSETLLEVELGPARADAMRAKLYEGTERKVPPVQRTLFGRRRVHQKHWRTP